MGQRSLYPKNPILQTSKTIFVVFNNKSLFQSVIVSCSYNCDDTDVNADYLFRFVSVSYRKAAYINEN